jgi:hypothetical protein
MKIYSVYNHETGYHETFHSLSAAKKAMKEHNAKGSITKVWSNGDWEPIGPIVLKGSNKHFVANTRQTKAGY